MEAPCISVHFLDSGSTIGRLCFPPTGSLLIIQLRAAAHKFHCICPIVYDPSPGCAQETIKIRSHC